MPIIALRAVLCACLLLSSTAATAAPSGLDFSAEIGAVTDYRFRGISLSDGKPAAQGSITVEHESGLYGSLWSSTIEKTPDGAVAELDIIAGYQLELGKGVTLDFAGTYYAYPGDAELNYAEATATASMELGAFTPSLGVSFVPKQDVTRDEDGRRHPNWYFFGRGEAALPAVPVSVVASVGYERGSFDLNERGGKWDWLVGVEVTKDPIKLGLSYVDTDLKSDDENSDPAIVGSLIFEF